MLPSDKYLLAMLRESGIEISDAEYEEFRSEARKRGKWEPGTIIAGIDPLSLIVFAVIGIGLQIAASFLKPKPTTPSSPTVNSRQDTAPDISRNQRFAPRVGFDSVQRPAALGSTIPIVYAKRQTLEAQASPPRPQAVYGGVRVNTDLLWSQLLSVGGGQMLRAIFLVGEGRIESLDCGGFAIGDNSISCYDYDANARRYSIYFRGDGGRITSADLIKGGAASSDLGNAENDGGQDVFAIRSTDNEYRQDFSSTSKPTLSTQFGVYSLIPNNLAVRINPRVRPTIRWQTQIFDDGNSVEADPKDDIQAVADAWKSKYCWSGRSGITTGSGSLAAGSTITYVIHASTDANTEIMIDDRNSDNEPGSEGSVRCGDVASIVSGRQRTADDALIVGELYKIGSCLAVLTSRTISGGDDVFISDSDNDPIGGGQNGTYTFTVVRAGDAGVAISLDDITQPDRSGAKLYPETFEVDDPADRNGGNRFETATSHPQIFRCAIANVITPRDATVIELGFRSSVGITVNGLCNFRDVPKLYDINLRAGERYKGQRYPSDKTFNLITFASGTLSTSELRYSFFNVYYRKENEEYQRMNCSIGVRSMTSQAIYNYLRLQMPTRNRWEFKMEPVTGWEIRFESTSIPLIVLDSKGVFNSLDIGSGVTLMWTGTTVARSIDTFGLKSLDPLQDIAYGSSEVGGYPFTMTDSWARVAEAFVYPEIQTTAQSGPEHEIVYVNVISENDPVPLYDNLAILGLNIRASTEWSQFSQFSCYVTGGRRVPLLLDSNNFGTSNLFPDILRDLLLNTRFGAGAMITNDQIDTASFITAAQWCQDRRYFFDGVIAEKINLRQWAADTAGTMLLDLVQRNGRFALEPSIVFGAALPIAGLFTAGNILEDTFELEFIEEEDRQPFQASVKWREERNATSYLSSGFFPVEREVLVREADRPDGDPIESFDLTDYCTNLEQAIDFACYVIRVRRLITHTIKFSTTIDALLSAIAAGDYIRVAMDYTYYDEFANGVVLADGTLVTTRQDLMPVGAHNVIAWDGSDTPPYDTTLTVSGGGATASPTGITFVKKSTISQVRTYKIESLAISKEGDIEIEAMYHPTDDAGISMLGKNWTTYVTDVNWIIERGA